MGLVYVKVYIYIQECRCIYILDVYIYIYKKKPTYLQDYDGYHVYCLLTNCSQPKTFQVAVESEDWKLAKDSELESHKQTWYMGTSKITAWSTGY